MHYTNYNYNTILFDGNIIALVAGTLGNGLIFLHKIMNDHLTCPESKSQREFSKKFIL